MLMWLIVIAIFGILGVTGYYKGAIRSSVSLVGLCFATFLALPLSPYLRPLVPKVGLNNPVWEWVLPPVVVFVLTVVIFTGLAFLVHHKARMHFKYATDEYTRMRWERLNQRLGLCVGLVAAGIYAMIVGLIIYVFGYPMVQVTGTESPMIQRFLASARKDLQETGFDKALASLDPMEQNYYLAADIIGLLYQNPTLEDRLLNYPAFLALSERNEIKDIAGDVDFLNAWQTKAPIMNLVNHPKVQTILKNADIIGEFKQIDLKDLSQYLTTGKSAKYDEERILGRWRLDVPSTFTLTRKKRPDMTAQEMGRIKTTIAVFLAKVSLMATPDDKFTVKVEMSPQANQIIEAAKAAVAAVLAAQANAGEPAAPQMPPAYLQRYRMRGNRPGAAPAVAPDAPRAAAKPAAAPKNLPGIPEINLAGQGSWERDGTKYKLKLTDEHNKQHSGEASADDDRLLVTLEGVYSGIQSLVFIR